MQIRGAADRCLLPVLLLGILKSSQKFPPPFSAPQKKIGAGGQGGEMFGPTDRGNHSTYSPKEQISVPGFKMVNS